MKVNGWINWDTWEANNWLTNDETVYKALSMCTDYHGVSGIFEVFFSDTELNISKVNWEEIYNNNLGG